MNYKAVPAIKTTLPIAMLGTIIMISHGAMEAESAKSDNSFDWCYVSAAPEDRFVCLPNHENCNKAKSSDLFASSSCFKNKWQIKSNLIDPGNLKGQKVVLLKF